MLAGGHHVKVRPKLTVSSEERDGSTLGTSTTSSANTVDVVLRVVRVVIVDHMRDVAHILRKG